jgi:hypothetical protein
MQFGIYVHQSGSTWLDVVVRKLSDRAGKSLAEVKLPEVDGLFIGLTASQSQAAGIKKLKLRTRRHHALKLISVGSELFRCLVELDALVSDLELVAHAETEEKHVAFVKEMVCSCVDVALADFPAEQAELVKTAVRTADGWSGS